MFNKVLILVITVVSFSCENDRNENECNSSIIISDVSFNVQQNNVLRYDINYQLSDTLQSFIKFWEKGKPENFELIKAPLSKNVNTVLYGIRASTDYELRIVFGEKCENGSDLIEFESGRLPFEELSNFEVLKDKNEFEGYVLFHQTVGSVGHLHVIVDNEGKVVWYQYFDNAVGTFSWTPDNTLLAVIDKNQIIEIDLLGNEKFSLKFGEKGFDKKIHHEIQKDDLGHIYGLTYEKKALDKEEKTKYGVDTLFCDGILVFDSIGDKYWEWSMYDVKAPIVNDFSKKVSRDWGHGNSLYDDRNGNFLISFRNINQVWSVNKLDGSINWKFGENGSFKVDKEDLFYGQHSVHINNNGDVMLFDNGSRKSGISRALSFKIDADSNKYEKKLDVKLPKNLYSFKKGNAQLLGDKYILFNSTMRSTVAISNLNDSLVWELKLPKATYRAEYIENIFYR